MKINRQQVYDKYDGHCAYCGKEISIKQMQVDHYYPKSAPAVGLVNGVSTDDIKNLMPSCRNCNHYKRALQPESFRFYIKTLHERVMKIYIVKVAIDFGIVKIKPFDGEFYFEYVERMKSQYLKP